MGISLLKVFFCELDFQSCYGSAQHAISFSLLEITSYYLHFMTQSPDDSSIDLGQLQSVLFIENLKF